MTKNDLAALVGPLVWAVGDGNSRTVDFLRHPMVSAASMPLSMVSGGVGEIGLNAQATNPPKPPPSGRGRMGRDDQ